MSHSIDDHWMRIAAELALRGQGNVEPNPPVGCVLVREGAMIGSGYHQVFGGPHAEIVALRDCVADVSGATAYVTLEPCNHFGKTPPCTDEIIRRRLARVVVSMVDPNPEVSGQGIERLRQAGIDVVVGVGTQWALPTLRPYLKRVATGYPWVIAKWAMSLDGKIATREGQSRWLSSPAARESVHVLRSRMDAIVTGIGTVLADDPLLTARPAGLRRAKRIILDSTARIPLSSQLVTSASAAPVVIAVGPEAPDDRLAALRAAGCDVWQGLENEPAQRLLGWLRKMAQSGMTNVLVEAGGNVLAVLQQLGQIDEIRAYLAPLVIGGAAAPTPVGGAGVGLLEDAHQFRIESANRLGDDVEVIAIKQDAATK